MDDLSPTQLIFLAITVPALLVILAGISWQDDRAHYDTGRGDRHD